jgi:site-specific DNA-cytosine methylase
MERKTYSKPQTMPDKTGTINTKNNSGQLSMDSGTTLIPHGPRIRKLHPVECERLQGLPDGYTEGVSNTQRYKMLGNGWQVDTIEHILRCNTQLMEEV